MDIDHLDCTIKKVLQSLLRSRRQLQELKTSISITLRQIKSLDQLLRQNQIRAFTNRRERHILSRGQSNLAQFQFFLECKKCKNKFSTAQELFNHQKNTHSSCYHCNQTYFQTRNQHQRFFCPSIKTLCQICGAQIERKSLNNHVKHCSFRKCYICQQTIYIKAYSYHLRQCGKQNRVHINLKNIACPSLKIVQNVLQNKKISILPCSLII